MREAEFKYLTREERKLQVKTVEQASLYLLPTSQLPLSNQSIRCWRTNRTTPLDFLGHLYREVRMGLVKHSTDMRVLKVVRSLEFDGNLHHTSV